MLQNVLVKRWGITEIPGYIDTTMGLFTDLQMRGVPHSLMVGKNGKPMGTFSGMPGKADLTKALDQLIK